MAANHASKTVIALTGVVLALWFSLILAIHLLEVFGPVAPDLFTGLAILVPVAVFVGGYFGVAGIKRYVLGLDLRLLTIVQAWRVVGAAFFFLYAHSILPGVWAFPAAFGDIAMGVTAPMFAMALVSGQSFPKWAFVVWNLLGIGDFLVAAILGIVFAESLGIRSGDISVQPMTVLPLVLFPTFIVPLFTLVHLSALFQIARQPGMTFTWAPGNPR